jgi:hypothetical protein
MRRSLSASDQCRERTPPKLLDQAGDGQDRRRVKRADRNTDRIEHADFQLLQRLCADVGKPPLIDETGEPFNLGHLHAIRWIVPMTSHH